MILNLKIRYQSQIVECPICVGLFKILRMGNSHQIVSNKTIFMNLIREFIGRVPFVI